MSTDDREALESAVRRLDAAYTLHRGDLQSDLRWCIGHGRAMRRGIRALLDQNRVAGGLSNAETETVERAFAGLVMIIKELCPIAEYNDGERL